MYLVGFLNKISCVTYKKKKKKYSAGLFFILFDFVFLCFFVFLEKGYIEVKQNYIFNLL